VADLEMANSFVDQLADKLGVKKEGSDDLRDINMLVNKYLLELKDSMLTEKLDEAYEGVTDTKSAPANITVSTEEIVKNVNDEEGFGGIRGMLEWFVNRDLKTLDPKLHPEEALLWGMYGSAIKRVKMLLDKDY
jgi:hypothetical protein